MSVWQLGGKLCNYIFMFIPDVNKHLLVSGV